MSRHAEPLVLLGLGLGLLVASGIAPRDRFTWWLEVAPVLIGVPIYELVEWWAAVLTGEAAAAFLGTQGDSWDTQWDMFLALVGALTAQLLLGRLHDRHLARLGRRQGR